MSAIYCLMCYENVTDYEYSEGQKGVICIILATFLLA